jgi:hypothetical protein
MASSWTVAPLSENLWESVGVCFDTDDGSLPGIEVAHLSSAGVAAVYAMLRRRSHLVGDPPVFWSRVEEACIAVDAVPNAAALVASCDADAFHHCISGIVAASVELPIIGVFVWPNAVELDYRMGSEWSAVRVAGFFELLRDCCACDPTAVIVPAEFEGPPYPDRFAEAWSRYQTNGGA